MKTPIFLAAMALLYLGPVLAGLIGAPWQVLPVFALIFLLWLITMRPAHSIGAPANRTDPALWLRLATALLVQLGVVAIGWGLGRLIAQSVTLDLTVAWPLALSVLSIPLARLARAPHTAEMDTLLDEILAGLTKAVEKTDTAAALHDALSTGNPTLIRQAADQAVRACADQNTPAILPADSDLLSAAATFAETGNEATAHSLRAVVKARAFAEQDALIQGQSPNV